MPLYLTDLKNHLVSWLKVPKAKKCFWKRGNRNVMLELYKQKLCNFKHGYKASISNDISSMTIR